jgi:hypothetical protein
MEKSVKTDFIQKPLRAAPPLRRGETLLLKVMEKVPH